MFTRVPHVGACSELWLMDIDADGGGGSNERCGNTCLFCVILYHKPRICQDRLGTNIGRLKRKTSLQAADGRAE
eukprot:COSAG06_NODE_898_length_11667_cov_4.407244_6_plen_74_part_00